MMDTLKTTLWFYTGADYLIINAFLWQNKAALEPCLEIVWNNNRAVIQEAEEQTPELRFHSSGIDPVSLYNSYRERTSETFNDAAKNKMIDQAIRDIYCICRSMQTTHEDLNLIRNVDARYTIENLHIGDIFDMPGLTSTSTTGQLIDYSQDNFRTPGQIFHIRVAANTPILPVENSKENEVLLPPMQYRVLDRYTDNGIDTVILDALHPLELEPLIDNAKAIYFN